MGHDVNNDSTAANELPCGVDGSLRLGPTDCHVMPEELLGNASEELTSGKELLGDASALVALEVYSWRKYHCRCRWLTSGANEAWQ